MLFQPAHRVPGWNYVLAKWFRPHVQGSGSYYIMTNRPDLQVYRKESNKPLAPEEA